MPITSSAKKALRVAGKKKVFNTRRSNAVDGALKSIKKLIKEKGGNGKDLLKTEPWIAAVLADSHILANSKGQYLQTLNSEKVEAGVVATGRRFTFDGLYNSKGELQMIREAPDSQVMHYVATSLSMQVVNDTQSCIRRQKANNVCVRRILGRYWLRRRSFHRFMKKVQSVKERKRQKKSQPRKQSLL